MKINQNKSQHATQKKIKFKKKGKKVTFLADSDVENSFHKS